MPRRPGLWLLAAMAAALVGIAAVAATDQRRVAFTLGVTPEREIVSLAGGRTVCQGPIDVSAAFDRVMLQVGDERSSAPSLAVEVRTSSGERLLSAGRVPGGYRAGETYVTAPVGRVAEGQAVAVCARVAGPGEVGLSGGPPRAARTSRATVDGRSQDGDLTLVFLRDRPRSALSLVPTMLERAALWRPGPVGPVLLALLLAAVAVGAPLLLGRAIRRASIDEPAGEAGVDPDTTG